MKTLMRNGRDRRSENPSLGHAKKERVSLFGTDQRITSGPAARRPHSKAEYMTAPERFADSQIPLAPRAPSRVGLQRRTGKRFLKPKKSHEQRGASSYSGARRASAVGGLVSGTLPAGVNCPGASCLGSFPLWPQGRGRPWFQATGAFPGMGTRTARSYLLLTAPPGPGRSTRTGR